MAEEFPPLFKAILDLSRAADAAPNAAERIVARAEVSRSVLVILGVANDALLEGRSAGIRPDKLVEALDILLRLSFVLGRTNSASSLDSAMSKAVANAIGLRFQAWLEKLSAETECGLVKPQPLRRMVMQPELQLNAMVEGDRADEQTTSSHSKADRQAINLMLLLERKFTEIALDQ